MSQPAADDWRVPDFDALMRAEERHFWFCGRNRVIASVVERLTRELDDGFRVLEVGCGNGRVLAALADVCRRGEVVGSELHAEGLEWARRRVACRLVQADVYDLPFKQEFDLVGMFDVLEHLPDDLAALRSLGIALRHGGRAVITVPAHRSLWSYADAASGHYRRYEPAELRSVLERAGLVVERLTPFMMCLRPLMWLARRAATMANRVRGSAGRSSRDLALAEQRVVPGINGVLTALLSMEAPLLSRGARLPFGTSLLAIARVPDAQPDRQPNRRGQTASAA